ncbi:MAG TPA: radical SAM protein, partial [Symbiobacteriaceae bacterium]|nr:radical SAM protein [Symbiobacteriaceae bacterium]
MNAEQLLLVLPSQAQTSTELTVNQWTTLIDQFRTGGGREVLLGGTEPLGYPGFWVLARKAIKVGVPRVTAYLSGSHLEPWVMRGMVESGVHVLIALDSLDPEQHELLHGPGSHARAMAAIEAFIRQGLVERVGVLATVTRLTREGLPMLATWAAGKGLSRFLWTSVPDGGWPSPQLKALRLSPEEKATLAGQMFAISRTVGSMYVGPLDVLEDPTLLAGYSPLLRVNAQGDACWGFSGEGGTVGNLRRT